MKFIKKLPAVLIACSLLFSVPALAEEASSEPFPLPEGISIEIDGSTLNPTDVNGASVPPFVENGTTYVPVRAIAEAFSLSISWQQDTKTVFIGEQGGTPTLNDYINIYIDGEEFIAKDVNGTRVYPILRDGTTYMPIRAVGEAFGKSVFWDNVMKTAVIITPLSESDMDVLKRALSDTASLEGYADDARFYMAVSEYDLYNADIQEVIGESGSDSLIFQVLPEDVISSCTYSYKSGSDIIFGSSIDSSILTDFAVLSEESLSGLELGRATLSLTVSNGVAVYESASIPVKYTINDQSNIAFLFLKTTISPEE